MNKKLTLLVAGALASVALVALPRAATAGELEAHCETAAICKGELTAGTGVPIVIENTAGEGFSCTGLKGDVSFTSTTTTGTVNLILTGCRETVTIFKFNCNSTGAASGEMQISNLTYHQVNLGSAGAPAPGITLKGINTTFECTGFSKKTIHR